MIIFFRYLKFYPGVRPKIFPPGNNNDVLFLKQWIKKGKKISGKRYR